MCYNQIGRIPPQCGALTGLERLLLSDNKLEAIPEELGLLTSLVELRLQCNKLADLPPQLAACGRMRLFNAGNNDVRVRLCLSCFRHTHPAHTSWPSRLVSCPATCCKA